MLPRRREPRSRAMRANEQGVNSDGTPKDGFATPVEDVAVTPTHASIRQEAADHRRPHWFHAGPIDAATAATLARAGFAGLLLILLIGGLGSAVLTGPQSCLGCDDPSVATLTTQASGKVARASRLEYTAIGEVIHKLEHLPSQWENDRNTLSKTAKFHTEKPPRRPIMAATKAEDSGARSPMTTSATGRLYQPKSLSEGEPSTTSHKLPALAAEVADAAPRSLKLSATSNVTNDIASPQSMLAVEQSPVNEIYARDVQVREREVSIPISVEKKTQLDRSVTQPGTSPRAKSKRRARIAKARKKARAASSDKVPGWAKKMYGGSWQDSAFAYQYR